jgi:hypothetical protein
LPGGPDFRLSNALLIPPAGGLVEVEPGDRVGLLEAERETLVDTEAVAPPVVDVQELRSDVDRHSEVH